MMHSYIGVVGLEVGTGRSVEERKAQGLRGGIGAVFWVTALALPAGQMSLCDAKGGGKGLMSND